MDVSCPQCETVYELDDRQVRTKAVTLKCSQCHHLFRLVPPTAGGDESQRRWMVRKLHSGDIFYFGGFDTLHEWIMAGKVEGDDEISRTGQSWTRLGEIGEFTPIFKVVASIASLSGKSQDTDKTLEIDHSSLSAKRDAPAGAGEAMAGKSPIAPATKRVGARTPAPSGGNRKASPPKKQAGAQRPGRKRKSTDPQFRTGKQPIRPRRGESTDQWNTPVGRPGGQAPSAPEVAAPRERRSQVDSTPPETKSKKGGPENPGESPSGERRGAVQLDDRRFRSDREEGQSQPEPAVNEPTLGELEYGADDEPAIDELFEKRRRWPAVLVVAVVMVAALAIWQREAVEQWVESAGVGDEEEEPLAEEVEQPPLDPVTEAIAELADGLDSAVLAADRVVQAKARSEAIAEIDEEIEAAVTSAGRASQEAAVPLLQRLLAGGRRSLDRGNSTQAINRFEQALQESPDNAEAIVGLGWAYLAQGSIDRAITHFERAIDTDPSMGEALIGVGRAERNRGQTQAALTAYEQYLDRFPQGEHASIAQYQSQQLRRSLGE